MSVLFFDVKNHWSQYWVIFIIFVCCSLFIGSVFWGCFRLFFQRFAQFFWTRSCEECAGVGGGEIVCDKKNSAYIFLVIIGCVGVQERVARLRHQILLHIAPN